MSAAKNRFGGIIDATRARQAEQPVEDDAPKEAAPAPQAKEVKAVHDKPRNGKSSNPDYRQVSAYIRRTTHTAAHKKLLDEGQQRDLSDVIEELLNQWAADA